ASIQAMKTMNLMNNMMSKDGSVFNAMVSNSMISDPYDAAESAASDAADKISSAKALKVGTAAEKSAAVAKASEKFKDASKQLDAARATYGFHGAAKLIPVVSLVAGGILLADTAGQVYYWMNGEEKLTPIGSWMVDRAKSEVKFPHLQASEEEEE